MFTLNQVVKEYLIERGDASMNTYAKTLQCGISGLRDLHYDVSGLPSVAFIEVTSLGTAPLPIDYVAYRTIGVIDRTGNVITMGRNDAMAVPVTTNDCGDPQRTISEVNPDNITNPPLAGWINDYRNGEYLGRQFGQGGGNNVNGYYKVMERDGYILLQNCVATHVYLEYLSDPSRANGNFIVHPFDVEPLKAFMYMRGMEFNPKISGGEKERAIIRYSQKKNHAKAQHNSAVISEWMQSMRKYQQATPKL